MTTKRTVLGLLGVGLLGTALTAGMCTPVDTGVCTGEADCATDQHCHPTLKQCVANCEKQTAACDEEPGTTCSTQDINGVYFKGICVCTPATEGTDSCTSPEKCNPIDRVCDTPCTSDADCSVYEGQTRTCREQGGAKFCLPPADSCTGQPATFCGADKVCDATGACVAKCTPGSCGTGKYCDDDRFSDAPTFLCVTSPTSCDNETDCFDNDIAGLCDPTTTNETHNLCVAPDDVTNTCNAPGVMETGGPILYVDVPADDVVEITDPNEDPNNCLDTASNTLMEATLSVEGTLNSAVYTNTKYYNGSAWALPYHAVSASSGGYTFLIVYLCFNASTETRAFMHDNGTGESNRVCVEF